VIDVDQSPFTGTPLEFYNSRFFRTLGEPAGGLLTTAAGALRLVSAFQGYPPSFLHPETTTAATQNQVAALGGGVPGWFTLRHCPWGLGPALAPGTARTVLSPTPARYHMRQCYLIDHEASRTPPYWEWF
jgi:hypothetical protein